MHKRSTLFALTTIASAILTACGGRGSEAPKTTLSGTVALRRQPRSRHPGQIAPISTS